RTLVNPVTERRNQELPNFAALFRYPHLPRPLGPIASLHQLVSEPVEKQLHALCFDDLERHPIRAWGAVVLLGHLVGGPKRLAFADVTIQPPESPRSFCLRLDVQSSSQVLQRDGCLCHRTPASP